MLGTEPAHDVLYGRSAHCPVACVLHIFLACQHSWLSPKRVAQSVLVLGSPHVC